MERRTWSAWPMLSLLGLVVAGCGGGEAPPAEAADDAPDEVASAENTNPRFGVWQMESDRPAPAVNLMTYEPYGDGGMRITVENTNEEGETNTWSYVTMFDGEFHPVEGQENATTAVEVVDPHTNHIHNARNGEVYQTIVNVLSEDGNTINNEYRRTNADGEEVVSHAVYRRIR
ncbi:MAG: hypothetical protein HKN73_01560 [Gemmatimonadetes bacterium]|nr:hypothetical protein [Gemmatimonadota bacterium]